MTEHVVLVDLDDNVVGTMQKMEAHLQGRLHRAFSVFIFNSRGELLLQQRALHKYHSGGKWTNTCCSHPRLAEDTLDAANRRLGEEMGMQCALQYGFNFTYRADMEAGVTEYELDHVYFGISDILPIPNVEEVAAFRYVDMKTLAKEMLLSPDKYTEWLKICFDQIKGYHHKMF